MSGKVYNHSFDDNHDINRTIDRYKAYYEDVEGHYSVNIKVVIED